VGDPFFEGISEVITESSLQKKSDGSIVFYPWGRSGNGYIVTPPSQLDPLRAFVRTHQRIKNSSFLLVWILGIIFSDVAVKGGGISRWVLAVWELGVLAALTMIVALWYAARVRRIVAGLPRSTEKFSRAEEHQLFTARINAQTIRSSVWFNWRIYALGAAIGFAVDVIYWELHS
jgi:hypothetical protein